MRKTLFLFLLLFSLTSSAQVKTFKGIIYDDYTSYHIKDVKVSPDYLDSIITSNEKGRFTINLPPKYRDTIVFSHPDYYPFVRRIGIGDLSKPQFIRLVPRSFKLDTICYTAYKENFWLRGIVKDAVVKKPIVYAEIRLENNKLIAYSDSEGKFEVAVPKTNNHLIVNHPEFNTELLSVKKSTNRNHYFEVRLDRKVPIKQDTSWMHRKNALSLSIIEIIGGGIGVRYERFLKFKHSVGLHSTYYFRGHNMPIPLSNSGTNKFTGIKLAPFYRFYVSRNYNISTFFEGKFISGYFNFSQLYYAYSDYSSYSIYKEYHFWTFGGSVAWGWAFKLPKTKHGLINLSIGYQFLPMNVPEEIVEYFEGGGKRTYEVSKNWWYFTGPGSMLEIKFTIGGIF